MADFQQRVASFPHQAQEFEQYKDTPARALLWEQGTAKSKPIIDLGTHLFLKGEINTVLIVAPNGVDENWTTDQIPEHLPEVVRERSMVLLHRPEKKSTKWHQKEIARGLYHDGLLWFVVPYDTFISKKGKAIIWDFLRKRRCLYALDEGSSIKTPSAKRTFSIVVSGKYAPYRRVLEGTPVSVGPFDVYKPIQFLDEDFWKRELEITTAVEFRQYFGVYKTCVKNNGDTFPQLVGYRRLPQLQELLKKISTRYLKSDVLKDLPEKMYSKRYAHMNPEQQRVYDTLKEELFVMLQTGQIVSTNLPIVLMLRLQQITCGYVPVDELDENGDPQPKVLLGATNPRLEVLEAACQATPHQAIIWARFHKDHDLIGDMLGKRTVRYDGTLSPDERQRNKEAFLRGDAQFLDASAASMSRGHTLNNALTTIYYNNSFKLIERTQSEDRNHRAGQKNAVSYIDIVVPGTVDESVLRNLRRKVEIAAQITGDTLKEWI